MREFTNAYRILVGKPEGKVSLADLCLDGRILLNLMLNTYLVTDGLD